jgi:flagellar biogenesis protein FliO
MNLAQMDVIQPAAAIVFVLALLGGVLMALRGRTNLSFGSVSFRNVAKNLEVIERISLGPQHSLHLVRTGSRTILIATSPQSCQLLEAPGPLDVAGMSASGIGNPGVRSQP